MQTKIAIPTFDELFEPTIRVAGRFCTTKLHSVKQLTDTPPIILIKDEPFYSSS